MPVRPTRLLVPYKSATSPTAASRSPGEGGNGRRKTADNTGQARQCQHQVCGTSIFCRSAFLPGMQRLLLEACHHGQQLSLSCMSCSGADPHIAICVQYRCCSRLRARPDYSSIIHVIPDSRAQVQ